MRKIFLILVLLFCSAVDFSIADDVFNSAVFISDENFFADELEQAMILESEGRYDDAIAVYIKLLGKVEKWSKDRDGAQPLYRATFYSDLFNKEALAARYLPVEDFILEQISNLPEKERAFYAQTISGISEVEFERAIDANNKAAISIVADKFWLANKGFKYLMFAGKLAFEAGEFNNCVNYFEKIFNFWEDKIADNPLCIVYLAASYLVLHDDWSFEKLISDVKKNYRGLSIVINQEFYSDIAELVTRKNLQSFLTQQKYLNEFSGFQSWVGNKQINNNFDFTRFNDVGLTFDHPAKTNNNSGNRFYRFYGFGNNDPKTTISTPATFHDSVIFSGSDSILKIEIDDEAGLVGKYEKLGYPEGSKIRSFTFSQENTTKYFPVVSGNYLYGVFRKANDTENRGYYYYGNSQTTSKVLMCLDLTNKNSLVWWVPGENIIDVNAKYDAKTKNFLSKLIFDEALTIVNNKLYVIGLYPDSKEVRYYLLCFDASPDNKNGGKLIWKTKIATELITNTGWGSTENVNIPSFAPVKYVAGSLYFLCNTGLFACVDSVTGKIKYINRYMRPKNVTDPNNRIWWGYNNTLTGTHWKYNEIYVSHGFTYVAPMDSRKLYVFNARTGVFAREFPYGTESVDDYEYILATTKNTLLIQGKTKTYGLNLALDFAPNSKSALNYELYNFKTVRYAQEVNSKKDMNPVIGRGIVGKNCFYVPTVKGLIIYDKNSGKLLTELLPWTKEFSKETKVELYLCEFLGSEDSGVKNNINQNQSKKFLIVTTESQIYIQGVE